MKHFLSYGGGIDSTALMLHLIKQGLEFEAIFADHGCDYPDTYEYVQMMNNTVHPITIIKATLYESGRTFSTLLEYCEHHQIIPSRLTRWCTQKFKVNHLVDYVEENSEGDAVQYIGIDYDESHRAKPNPKDRIPKLYPLVENGIGRKQCEVIIKEEGLPIPRKSGCWFCPFQGRKQWQYLFDHHPCLFKKAQELEQNTNDKIRNKDVKAKPFYLYGKKPLAAHLGVVEEQEDLFGWRRPCQCGL